MSSPIDLIAAVLGLGEVDSLIKAIRAVDQSAPPIGTDGGSDCGFAPSTREPAASYEPGPVIQLDPRYEPRQIIPPGPRIERDGNGHRCDAMQPVQVVVVEKVPSTLPPEPPWKTLPWENPPQIARTVKVARYRPDNWHRGLLLDCFI